VAGGNRARGQQPEGGVRQFGGAVGRREHSGRQRSRSQRWSGAADVHIAGASGYQKVTSLIAPNGAAGDYFGAPAPGGGGPVVAISSDARLIVVGAPYAAASTGRAYVYLRYPGANTWEFLPQVLGPPSGYRQFGTSVAVAGEASGYAIVVGAPLPPHPELGIVCVYNVTPAHDAVVAVPVFPAEPTSLLVSPNPDHAGFGTSVAISADGSTIAVSAPGAAIPIDHTVPPNQWGSVPPSDWVGEGAVYVYTIDSAGTWAPHPKPLLASIPRTTLFGRSLAISEDASTIVIGASDLELHGLIHIQSRDSAGTCRRSTSKAKTPLKMWTSSASRLRSRERPLSFATGSGMAVEGSRTSFRRPGLPARRRLPLEEAAAACEALRGARIAEVRGRRRCAGSSGI